MNALLLSAVLGVVMMFSGLFIQQRSGIRAIAITGLIGLIIVNFLEMRGIMLFEIDTRGMMDFDRFSLLFNTIALASTLIYFILSARDMEKVSIHYAEFFALIYFILCGICLT